MKIAQISPLFERVPPRKYGGTERVVSWLTEELVAQGHQVTLFASGDSITSANLVAGYPHSLREQGSRETLAPHILMLEEVFSRAHEFDVLHFHIDVLQYPLSRRQQTPHLTTLHGRLDFPELYSLYRKFRQIPVAAISDSQRKQLPWLNWRATVHHGMPKELFGFRPKPGAYLAFLGRISPEKRADWAIQIAQRACIPLRIAAKVDEADRPYFKREIEPLLKGSNAEFIGEIGDSEKERFLGEAYALLFPVDWPEPFGIVMIEAMACGTPVVAYRQGSVPEIITDGETGFVVDNLDDAVAAVGRIPELRRARCRQVFEERFSARRMARDYLRIYTELANGEGNLRIAAASGAAG
jgi:glycosyltransferase involved in cell wall biosynthesis